MYRLRVIPIFLPPLKDRGNDVALLTDRFIVEFNATSRRYIEHVSPEARAALANYDFPGNVRELRNVLQYAFAIGRGPTLLASDLPPEMMHKQSSAQETMFPPEVSSFRASLIPKASHVPSSMRPPSLADEYIGGPAPRVALKGDVGGANLESDLKGDFKGDFRGELGREAGSPYAAYLSSPPPPAPIDRARRKSPEQEVSRIRGAIAQAGGNREEAAKLLGISRVTLWRRMRQLGLLVDG
jgi:DNA-binding NtrC family response regulator